MLSILLIDDEPNVLAALSRTLRRQLDAAVRIETWTDPHAALARVGTHEFDLIVADCHMPLMDGIQFLRSARDLQPEALRIIVGVAAESGGTTAAIDEIDEIGMFRRVVKPWPAEQLVQDVRAALAQAAASYGQRELAAAIRVASCTVDRAKVTSSE